MTAPASAAVVGLGLIGGSLARDLAAAGTRVLGWDADAATLDAALASGVVTEALDAGLSGIGAAQVAVLAVPVTELSELFGRLESLSELPALVTDAASTKRSVLGAVAAHGFGSHFVGSHPLAGDHRGGWDASRRGLFRDATVYLTPAPEASAAARAAAAALWSAAGALPVEISAAEHDRLLAWTSHLPQALASTLAATLAGRGISRAALGPGGRDTTRLAASPAALWAGILDDNRDEVLAALAAFSSNLAALAAALEARDQTALAALLGRAAGWGHVLPDP